MLAARRGSKVNMWQRIWPKKFFICAFVLFFLPFRLLICWLQATWCLQVHLAWSIDTTCHLAVQPRLMGKARVSLSLVLLPSHGGGWRPLQKTKISLRPFSTPSVSSGSCIHKMQKWVCGYLSKKKELCPHAYLRPKSIRLLRAGYGEMRKQQNPIFSVVKFCLDVILMLFSRLNSSTEKFYSRCCSGNILGLPRQEWGGER